MLNRLKKIENKVQYYDKPCLLFKDLQEDGTWQYRAKYTNKTVEITLEQFEEYSKNLETPIIEDNIEFIVD